MPDSLQGQKVHLRFARSGGVRQVRLRDPDDLPGLLSLNPRNWMALSCPAKGHEMDDRTLAAMDTDGDSRLRVREVRQTIRWLMAAVSDLKILAEGNETLALEHVRDDTPEGSAIRLSISHLLHVLETPARHLTLKDLAEGRRIMKTVPMNGDGILDPRATDDPVIKELIETVVATVGGVTTEQGTEGVTKETVDTFYAACQSFANWHESGYSESAYRTLFFLGEETETATEALEQVEAKISEWFALCETFAYAPDLAKSRLEAATLEQRPLAPVNSPGILSLSGPFNPAWQSRIDKWIQQTVVPVLGEVPEAINKARWADLRQRFDPYRTWRANQPGSSVSSLGIEGALRWLGDDAARGGIFQLIEEDIALKDEIEGVAEVERLMFLKRDFWEFIHNFVNFERFYDLADQAIFQVGILYLDGRSFHLCVPVHDQKGHTALAAQSGLYLVYCQLSRPGQANGPLVAAAVTNGDHYRLMVGKHGVFYDREDLEWDARIVQIIAHPINLRQAVYEPFRRLGNLLVSHIEKLSASREKALQADVVSGVTDVETSVATATSVDTPAQPAAPAERQAAGVGGFMAGGGVAIAAVTSSLALLSSTLARINPIYFLFAFLSLLALILLPTLLIAWIRLRKRDIGLLLEAGGWAVNAPMRLTGPLGRRLTLIARRR